MSVYNKLAENEIRLLVLYPGAFHDAIRISLRPVSLVSSAIESYQALSYVWGDVNQVERIDCDGSDVEITCNLACALRHIRSENQSSTFWADAICINQADLSERSQQVALMRLVYMKADNVVIWVGEADDSTEDVMSWFEEFDKHFEDETHNVDLEYMFQQDNYRQRLVEVSSFVSRPWFYRAWTFPEACLANSAHVQCGNFTLPWLTLCTASILARSVGITQTAFGSSAGHVASLTYYSVMARVGGSDFGLRTLLRQTRPRLASDPRDKVYSLLGLLPAVDMNVDYHLSVEELYCAIAKKIIATDWDLNVLSESSGIKNNSGLPSWVPDWREVLESAPLCQRSDDQSADGEAGPIFAVHSGGKGLFLPPGTADLFKLGVQGYCVAKVLRVKCLRALTNTLEDHKDDWKQIVDTLFTFLEQTGLGINYQYTQERSMIALLRTLSGDTLPISERVGPDLRQKRYAWHHDWFRQQIDIDLKAYRRQRIVKHFGVDSLRTKARYRNRAFDMSERLCRVYEKMFCQSSGKRTEIWRKWAEDLSKLSGDTRPTYEYFTSQDTRSRIAVELVDSILEWTRGRSFVITDNGLMGIAPTEVACGDSVYLLCGATVPCVLRTDQHKSTLRNLVGECYLHGIMYGLSTERKNRPELAIGRLENIVMV